MRRHASVPRKVKYAISSKPSSRPTAASHKLWYLWQGVRVRSHLSLLFLCGGLVVNLKPLSDTSRRRRSAPSLPPSPPMYGAHDDVACFLAVILRWILFYVNRLSLDFLPYVDTTTSVMGFRSKSRAELCPAPPRCRPTSCRRSLSCFYVRILYPCIRNVQLI